MESENTSALRIFFSYAQPDKELRDKLENHLAILKNYGVISGWHDRHISGGQEWSQEISEHLEKAHIILLLISADFLSSRYCYGVEMARALEKHAEGNARVVPIILRHVDWQGAPFSHLQALPTKGNPVEGGKWTTQDEAFTNIARGIRQIVSEIRSQQPENETQPEEKQQQRVIPGGMWAKPQDRTAVGDTIELAAFAYPTHAGEPLIERVEFTAGWSGQWRIAQTVYPQIAPNEQYFCCTFRLRELFPEIPLAAGEFKVSFDVYDRQGNKNAAPHGTRVLLYRPDGAPDPENALSKSLSWLEQNTRRIFGKT